MLRVLIADDDPVSLTLLGRALEKNGYIVESFKDGDSAWQRLKCNRDVDIAILDWFMPGLLGPEVTERYAKSENSRFLYTMILSGQLEKEMVIKALHHGAHDILEKPLDLRILQSRLTVAAKILREKRAVEASAAVMERYGTQMEQLANERAHQLVHAERMSSLGVMAAGVAHEINNPLSFISGNAQSLQRYWEALEPLLLAQARNPEAPSSLPFIVTEVPKTLASIMRGVERVTAIVKGLKKYSGKTEQDFRDLVDMHSCVEQALVLCKGSFPQKVDIQRHFCASLPKVRANPIEIEQVLINLFVNAAQAMEGKETRILSIASEVTEDTITLIVEDTGSGIPPHLLAKIWDPFVSTKPVGQGTGLGLAISAGIIKGHGGQLTARNIEGSGAHFELKLPLQGEDHP